MARKKQEKRQEVRQEVLYATSLYDIQGEVDGVVGMLQERIAAVKKDLNTSNQWTDSSRLEFEVDRYVHDYGDEHPRTELKLFHIRLENDVELEARLKKESDLEAAVKEREIKEFARLSAKYGAKK